MSLHKYVPTRIFRFFTYLHGYFVFFIYTKLHFILHYSLQALNVVTNEKQGGLGGWQMKGVDLGP
jgi:hypothetical protein